MPRVVAGGFRAPFEPFADPQGGPSIVDATENGLQLGATKLASKGQNAWVVGASWLQPESPPPGPGDPPPDPSIPAIAGGAVAWIAAGSTTWNSKVWDGDPLPEDPRPEASRQPWGAFKPKWHDHGLFIGTEIFPKEETETTSGPSLTRELEIDISPGFTVFKTDGLHPDMVYINAIAGQLVRSDGCYIFPPEGSQYGYGQENDGGGNYGIRAPFSPYLGEQSVCIVNSGTIQFTKFWLGQTVAQVQAINDRPTPVKPSPEVEIGDRVGVLNYQIFYQNAQGPYYLDLDGIIYSGTGWPAGTWEVWTFSSVSTVQGMNYSTTNGYGLIVTGVVGEGPSVKTGKIHQLLWSYGDPILLEGTWRYEEERIRRGEESKPDGSPPGPGNTPVSGGGGGSGGWPSERDRRTREGQFFNTATINFPSYSNLYGETMTVPVTWTIGTRDVTYQGLRSESVAGYSYSVTYDTRKGSPPRWLLQTTPNVPITYREFAPYPVEPLFNGVSFVLVGPTPPCQVTSWTTNPATGGLVSFGPGASGCDQIAEFYYGNLINDTVTRSTPYLDPARAPIESPPDPNQGSPIPGSGVPGSPFGPEPGSPGLGVPNLTPGFPGAAPNSDWVEVLAVEQEYELMAAVGETLRSRRWYRERREDGLAYQARWNLQSIIETGEVEDLELDYEIPFPLVFRSPTNSEDTYPEEALYLVEYRVQSDWDNLDPEVQAVQEWTDRKVFYLKDNGGGTPPAPVEVDDAIFDFLPEIGLAAPDQYRFERNLVLHRGILYVIPPPDVGTDYRASAATLNLTAYRVDDGSFSEVTNKRAKILSLKASSSVVDDASFLPVPSGG